jgi:hypothetical protein
LKFSTVSQPDEARTLRRLRDAAFSDNGRSAASVGRLVVTLRRAIPHCRPASKRNHDVDSLRCVVRDGIGTTSSDCVGDFTLTKRSHLLERHSFFTFLMSHPVTKKGDTLRDGRP